MDTQQYFEQFVGDTDDNPFHDKWCERIMDEVGIIRDAGYCYTGYSCSVASYIQSDTEMVNLMKTIQSKYQLFKIEGHHNTPDWEGARLTYHMQFYMPPERPIK